MRCIGCGEESTSLHWRQGAGETTLLGPYCSQCFTSGPPIAPLAPFTLSRRFPCPFCGAQKEKADA